MKMAKNGRIPSFSTDLHTVLLCVICLSACLTPVNVWAKEPPVALEQSALEALARNFVASIGNKLKDYDQKQAQKPENQNQLSLISDGEMLLLRPKAEKLVLDSEIAAVKQNGVLYLSLEDIIRELEFAIDYDPEKKIGSGWFLREDWLIRMDFVKGEVVSRGQTFTLKPGDIYEEAGDIYISQAAASEWISMQTDPDFAQQYLEIKTPYPFPALARNARNRETDGRSKRNVSVLPRHKQEEKMFDINTIETQQSLRSTRSKDRPTTTSHQNITSLEGEVLNHNAYGLTFWDSEEQLGNIRARLSKESENADLLGFMNARAYTFGDTDLTSLPLTGGSSQEFGFRVNNNPLRNADFQTTVIRGDSLPGWDVELYREGGLIDRIRVEEDARYEFQDIELFAGDNLFEVFFYGPQGEIRRDNFNLPVNEDFLATQDDTYDVSLSFNDSQTYNKISSEDEDANTPHLVARYNKVLGNTLAYAGVRARQVNGEQKGYLGTGFTNIWNGFIFDGNAAFDEQAAKAFDFGARKNIADWRLSLRGNMQDEDYISEGGIGSLRGVQFSANRNFITPFDTFASLTANARYDEQADNSSTTSGSININHQFGALSVSNTTTVTKTEFDDNLGSEDQPTRINDSITARYNFGRVFARAGVNYNVKPESKVDDYFAQITYQPSNRFSGDLLMEHDPDTNLSQGRLSLNYRHDKFRLSPYLDVDSESKVQTGIKLSTTFVDEPGKILPLMTSDRIIGRGMVSAFVFHDKDGNKLFDGEDVPLPDVIVESVNITRKQPTNEKGYSLIKDLPENFVTDVRVDRASLPDPFMIPGFQGVSVFPKAGQMIELNFPIHIAGEVDGNVYLVNADIGKEAARMGVSLIPVDGASSDIISVNTAFDGYFVLSNIPPGSYLLTVNADQASRLRSGGVTPVPITIGYDGTVVSGQDLTLQKNRAQVPVSLKKIKSADQKVPFFALKTGNADKTKLAILLEKMIEKKSGTRAKEGLVPLALEGSEDLKILPGQSWAQHFDRCQMLNDQHVPCEMILFLPEDAAKTTKTASAK